MPYCGVHCLVVTFFVFFLALPLFLFVYVLLTGITLGKFCIEMFSHKQTQELF